ncbi:hypothetical protein WMY93_001601 [Mugilogobius chulae]|uniref:branched-chain-amino-acid transaminase n=1 Tax=Mugilogobius chulae TaxID=88201 RepID=A0AAW0PRT4_9GOBI
MGRYKCCADNCESSSESDIKFFKFPLYNPKKLRRWLSSMGREDWTPSRFSVLCIHHFEEKHVDRTGKCITLREEAVPTVFNPQEENREEERESREGEKVDLRRAEQQKQRQSPEQIPVQTRVQTQTKAKTGTRTRTETRRLEAQVSEPWSVIVDEELLKIHSFPHFFHGNYCASQDIHWAPDKPSSEETENPTDVIEVTGPWQWLTLDVRGPLPQTSSGHRFVLSLSDVFSKWLEAFPLESLLPEHVVRHLLDVIGHFGFPVRILSRLPLRPSNRLVQELSEQNPSDWDLLLPAKVFTFCCEENPSTENGLLLYCAAAARSPTAPPRTADKRGAEVQLQVDFPLVVHHRQTGTVDQSSQQSRPQTLTAALSVRRPLTACLPLYIFATHFASLCTLRPTHCCLFSTTHCCLFFTFLPLTAASLCTFDHSLLPSLYVFATHCCLSVHFATHCCLSLYTFATHCLSLYFLPLTAPLSVLLPLALLSLYFTTHCCSLYHSLLLTAVPSLYTLPLTAAFSTTHCCLSLHFATHLLLSDIRHSLCLSVRFCTTLLSLSFATHCCSLCTLDHHCASLCTFSLTAASLTFNHYCCLSTTHCCLSLTFATHCCLSLYTFATHCCLSLYIFTTHCCLSLYIFTTRCCLSLLVQELSEQNPSDWDLLLPAKVFRFCCEENPSTGERPFTLLCCSGTEPHSAPEDSSWTTIGSEAIVQQRRRWQRSERFSVAGDWSRPFHRWAQCASAAHSRRRTCRGVLHFSSAQTGLFVSGFWETLFRSHVGDKLEREQRLGQASHPALPEPVAAPGLLRAALLHRVVRGDEGVPRSGQSHSSVQAMLNMERMHRSAERSCLPAFDKSELLKCIKKLVELDQDWVPFSQTASLYIRPTFIGTEGEFSVVERTLNMQELLEALDQGRVLEVFGAGTACVVCPVGSLLYKGKTFEIPTMKNGPDLAKRFYKELTDIQYGRTKSDWAPLVV